jgi:hypothetical protein
MVSQFNAAPKREWEKYVHVVSVSVHGAAFQTRAVSLSETPTGLTSPV